jgi:hypothetical protein
MYNKWDEPYLLLRDRNEYEKLGFGGYCHLPIRAR